MKTCGFSEFYSEADVHRAIGIIRTNCIHVQPQYLKNQDVSARAVFPTFSNFSHSCVANGKYCVSTEPNSGARITVRAQTPIVAGQEVTVHYISFMYGHFRRKRDIEAFWFFKCKCRRCLDPTELGSELSAMKCSECGNEEAVVLPVEAGDVESEWQCNRCKA